MRAFHAKTVEIVERVERDYRPVENDPDAWVSAWESVYTAVDELRRLWDSDTSGKIPDVSVVAKYVEVVGQSHYCVGRIGIPDRHVVSAGANDFFCDAGRLLMLPVARRLVEVPGRAG